MKEIKVILNPAAGRGRAKKAAMDIMRELTHQSIPYSIDYTDRPGHATELASNAARNGFETVVVVGGDGTIHEVATGLAHTNCSMAVIPRGSGNDFAKLLNPTGDMAMNVKHIKNGSIELFDTGSINALYEKSSAPKTFRFVNHVGIGFDATVSLNSRKTKWLQDTPLYAWAVLKTLVTYRPTSYEVEIDGQKIDGKFYLVAIGNGVCVGGGFYLTPDASPKDGLFDVCTIDAVNKLRIVLRVLPSVLSGKHKSRPEVCFYRGKLIIVRAKEPVCVHADGEIVGTDVRELEIRLDERSLKVHVNPKDS